MNPEQDKFVSMNEDGADSGNVGIRKMYAEVACKQCQNPLHVLFFCIGAYIFVLLLLICISLRVQKHKNIL